MLENLLEQKNISAYALSKKTGIPYSTISDIVNGKTDITNVSAKVLYNLSKGLGVTMEQLYLSDSTSNVIYLYNQGRDVFLILNNRKFMYKGPKNLVGFRNVNAIKSNTIYVDTFFQDKNKKIYVEEDYIDLVDVFDNDSALLDHMYTVKLGTPGDSKSKQLMDSAIMVSDNMCISESDLKLKDITIEVKNIKRNKARSIIRLTDYAILYSNMSSNMQKRALEAVQRNKEQILEEIEERNNAKVH